MDVGVRVQGTRLGFWGSAVSRKASKFGTP